MRLIDADPIVDGYIKAEANADKNDDFVSKMLFQGVVITLLEAPTIKTKEIKYYDEEESVWKIGRVIVDE